MKISKVSESSAEKALYNSLMMYNLRKNSVLNLLTRLGKIGVVATGIGTLGSMAIDYFYSEEGSKFDLAKVFIEKSSYNFYKLVEDIYKACDENNHTTIQAVIEKLLNPPPAPPPPAEQSAEPEEKKFDPRNVEMPTSMGSATDDHVIKKYSGSGIFSKKDPKNLLKYFCSPSPDNLHKRIERYRGAHTLAEQSYGKYADIFTQGAGLTFSLAKKLGTGDFSGFGQQLSESDITEQTLAKIKDKNKMAAEEYMKCTSELIRFLHNAKRFMEYCSENAEEIEALTKLNDPAINDSVSKLLVLLERISIPFNLFAEIIRPLRSQIDMASQRSAFIKKFYKNKFIPERAPAINFKQAPRWQPYKSDMVISIEEQEVFTLPQVYVKFDGGVGKVTPKKLELIDKEVKKTLNVSQKGTPFGKEFGTDNDRQRHFYIYLNKNGFIDQVKKYYLGLTYYLQNEAEGQALKAQHNAFQQMTEDYNFFTMPLNYCHTIKTIYKIITFEKLYSRGASNSEVNQIRTSFAYFLSRYITEYLQSRHKGMSKEYLKRDKQESKYEKRKKFYSDDFIFNNNEDFVVDDFVTSKEKLKNIKKKSKSINNRELIMKKSNSDQYYKDAIMGLSNSDPLLKEFYNSMKLETMRRSELRDDRKNLMSLTIEQDAKDITNSAHPKSIKLSDGHNDGGVVENGHEQKEKSLEVAKRDPTGNFMGRYAWMRKHLNK